MDYVSACSFAAAETGVQKEQAVQEKKLTTKEKEHYLKGRRSKTIQQSIDKCKTEIPHDVQISLHYNYLKALDMLKAKAQSTSGSVKGNIK